jgi:hypothetical protein
MKEEVRNIIENCGRTWLSIKPRQTGYSSWLLQYAMEHMSIEDKKKKKREERLKKLERILK